MNEITTTTKYYNEKGQLWVDTKTNSFVHEKPFVKLLTLWPEKGRIVDIGCAGGIHLPLFLGLGRKLKYLGLDISSFFLKVAARRYPHLTFAPANIADSTTLPKTRFDGFFAAATLMHIPFELWDPMFNNIEKMCKQGSFGYITLPVSHPSGDHHGSDVRHFTLLSEAEQIAYIKTRKWKIRSKGTMDGVSTTDVWRWYIIKLPT